MSGIKVLMLRVLLAAIVLGLVPAPALGEGRPDSRRTPIVIGHRGASGYLPEHTLEGYALAIELGADYVEPDLVMTKDGHLIARHEPSMINTTDVKDRPEFGSRKRTAVVDGTAEEGWFASDFTLAEIKTLRAIQAFGERPQQFNGEFRIPTLEQIIELVKRKSKEKERTIGIYPETKHPTYHRSLGLPLEPKLVDMLRKAGWDRRDAPVFIQSFEQSNLKALRRLTKVRLIQLVDANDVNPDGSLDFTAPFDRPYDWTVSGDPVLQARLFSFFATDAGLKEIRTYADGIGPWKRYIVSTAATDLNGDGVVGRRERRWGRQRGRPNPASGHRSDPARASARIARPHVDLPQRAAPRARRLRTEPGQRIPPVLRAGDRRRVQRLSGHRGGITAALRAIAKSLISAPVSAGTARRSSVPMGRGALANESTWALFSTRGPGGPRWSRPSRAGARPAR
jgi:glycerophosphoryl diester phosphodiesterase